MQRNLESLARDLGGKVTGDGSVVIAGVGGIEEAKEGDITFVTSEKFIPLLSM